MAESGDRPFVFSREAYLGYAALFVLKVVCILCLTTYAAVIGVFVVSGLAASLPMKRLPRRIPGDLRALAACPAALAVVLVFVATAAFAVGLFPSEGPLRAAAQQAVGQPVAAPPAASLSDQFTRWWEAQPRIPMPVSSDGAAVVVVKFTDIQCGLCGATHFALKSVLARYEAQYPGAVKYIVKDYPLQSECNTSISRPFHLAACDAAVAVRLARQNGKSEALEDWLYRNQALITPTVVRQVAASVGGVKDFDAAYARTIAAVKTDVSLGHLLKVHGTPTFYVNGVRAEDGNQPITVQYIDLAIALELKKAGVAK